MTGIGIAVGVRGEVARDVLHELASFCSERDREDNGRQVRTAPAERDHPVAVAARKKPRGDDDVMAGEQRVQAERTDERPAACACRAVVEKSVEKPGLLHVDADRAHTASLEGQCHERDRSELPCRPEQVAHRRIGWIAQPTREIEECVGHALFGRDDDHETCSRLVGDPAGDEARRAFVGGRSGEHRPADLDDPDAWRCRVRRAHASGSSARKTRAVHPVAAERADTARSTCGLVQG